MEGNNKEGNELKVDGIEKEGVKILCGGYDKPLNDAMKIQEALSPLGYIVQGFGKEGGLFLLRLMPTKW
jgi:hypothetical protein